MNKFIGVCVSVAALVAMFAPQAEAASRVRLYRVYFDSPGSDTRTNTSLNGEWAQLKNYGTTTQNLYGWKISDQYGWTYTFGTYYLKPGAYVHVHTGKGTNSGGHRFWGRGNYVWNNTGDTAYLRSKSGATVDTCGFSGAGDSVYC